MATRRKRPVQDVHHVGRLPQPRLSGSSQSTICAMPLLTHMLRCQQLNRTCQGIAPNILMGMFVKAHVDVVATPVSCEDIVGRWVV